MAKAIKITEDDQEVYLTIEDDRLEIDWIYFDYVQEDGTKVEGGGCTFSIPLDKVKELIESAE